jgi:hypothetical protein
MIIFTIPVFAIICDWTDALALLNNDGQIDREKYQAKQSRIKNIFLGVSTLIIVAMWTNMAGEILDIEVNWNSWPTFYSIVNVLTWAFSLFICLFMLAVTLQIIVLYTQVMKVLNNIRKLIVQHNQDIK